MGELSLVLFTILLQAAIGVMVFMAFMQQKVKGATFKNAAYASAGMAVLGMLFSLAHLGQPFIAYNSILNVGKSWLSNEILFVGGFSAIAVLNAILIMSRRSSGLNNILLWVGSIVGLLAVFAMARVYTFTVVPAWNSPNIYVDFFAAAITMGGVIFWALSAKEIEGTNKQILATVVLAAAVIQAASASPYLASLVVGGGASAVSAAVVNEMGSMMLFRWLFVLGGAGVLMLPATVDKKSVSVIYSAAAVLILGQIFGRYIFYASGIIPGIGV